MGWGQGIGIGWPNASASAVPPGPQESYTFYNCVAEEYNNTNQYPAGSSIPGYRVVINNTQYGYITDVIPSTNVGYNISNLPIGYVDNRCNDCNVYLSPTLNNGYGENWQYYMDLTGIEQLGEVEFASDVNTLTVNVNYYVYFESNEGPGPVTRQGDVQFIIPTYLINAGTSALLDSMYIFDIPQNDYFISESAIVVTSIEIADMELGPYDTGYDVPNKYVTNYGNVWTFSYPNNG